MNNNNDKNQTKVTVSNAFIRAENVGKLVDEEVVKTIGVREAVSLLVL